jgi:hypothetical protein
VSGAVPLRYRKCAAPSAMRQAPLAAGVCLLLADFPAFTTPLGRCIAAAAGAAPCNSAIMPVVAAYPVARRVHPPCPPNPTHPSSLPPPPSLTSPRRPPSLTSPRRPPSPPPTHPPTPPTPPPPPPPHPPHPPTPPPPHPPTHPPTPPTHTHPPTQGSHWLDYESFSTRGSLSVHINANREGNGKRYDHWLDFATGWWADPASPACSPPGFALSSAFLQVGQASPQAGSGREQL